MIMNSSKGHAEHGSKQERVMLCNKNGQGMPASRGHKLGHRKILGSSAFFLLFELCKIFRRFAAIFKNVIRIIGFRYSGGALKPDPA